MRIQLTGSLEQGDHIRYPRAHPGYRKSETLANYSEWHHFNFNDDTNDLYGIVNLAMSGNIDDADSGRVAVSLVICEHGRWRGTMAMYRATEARFTPGRVDLKVGPNSVRLRQGCYEVAGSLKDRSVVMNAVWRPLCAGVHINNIGGIISTFVIPRMSVEGTLVIEGRTYRLNGATGYHDHNWGYWNWGRDLGWDWGYVLENQTGDHQTPLSIVFGQVTDATRAAARSDLVFIVWEGNDLTQVFLDDAVNITTVGALPFSRVPQVPGLLGFIQARRHEVPASLIIQASDGADALELQMDVSDGLQFLLPQAVGPGLTTVSELVGRYRVKGTLDGRSLDFSYVGFAELAG
jgi:hypothetical protein